MTKEHSNTEKKQTKAKRNTSGLIPFKKGKGADIDPRINTKGRPKNFDQLRALFQDIAAEDVQSKKEITTRARHIGRTMAEDKKLMRDFLEFAFGKVPQAVDLTSKGKQLIDENGVYDRIMAKIQKRMAGNAAEGSGKPDQEPEA